MVQVSSLTTQEIQWHLGSLVQPLVAGEVHVWRVDLTSPLPSLADLTTRLSAEEINQYHAFKREGLRQKYAVSHLALREILSNYQGDAPESLVYSEATHGKPYLKNSPLQFNLTHSGDIALVAVTMGESSRVGVDIEWMDRQVDVLGLAERFFADNEFQELRAAADDRRTAAFFAIWTLKEAFVKALGRGLSVPLKDFEVEFAKDNQCLVHCSAELGDKDSWLLRQLPIGSGYAAALAVTYPSDSIKYFVFDDAGVMT